MLNTLDAAVVVAEYLQSFRDLATKHTLVIAWLSLGQA